MPVITAETNDGYVRASSSGRAFWADARDATTGAAASSTANQSRYATRVRRTATPTCTIYRSFYCFDCSGISSEVASVSLKIRGLLNNDANVIVVKASAPNTDGSTALATSDFDAIVGFSAGASMSGNVTDYSSEVSPWSTGLNTITLNAQALSDLQTADALQVCVVEYDHDYLNSSPAEIDVAAGQRYANALVNYRPFLDYTLSTGYGNSVCGMPSGNISAVDGVLTANVSKVSGI
jgi:hypothetical protein